MFLIIIGVAIDLWLASVLFTAVTTDAPPTPPPITQEVPADATS